MRSKERSGEVSGWREIASLGEQLANATSLSDQRDRITSMASRMLRGHVDVWLHESLFRLPDWDAPRTFPAEPRSDGMRKAMTRRKLYVRRMSPRDRTQGALAAMPIEDQGLVLGVLQVSRRRGPDFGPDELELLASVTSVVAIALYAPHRVEV